MKKVSKILLIIILFSLFYGAIRINEINGDGEFRWKAQNEGLYEGHCIFSYYRFK